MFRSSAPAAGQSVSREATEVLVCKWQSVEKIYVLVRRRRAACDEQVGHLCISEWMCAWIDECVVKALWVVHLYKLRGHLPLRQSAGLLSGLRADVPECIARLKEKLQTVTGCFRKIWKNVKIYIHLHILYDLLLIETALYIVFFLHWQQWWIHTDSVATFTAGQLIILPALPLNVSETRQLQREVVTVSFWGSETKNLTLHFDVFGQLEWKMCPFFLFFFQSNLFVLCGGVISLHLAGYLTE